MFYLGNDDREYQHEKNSLIHPAQAPVKSAAHRKSDSRLRGMLRADKQKSASESRFLPLTSKYLTVFEKG